MRLFPAAVQRENDVSVQCQSIMCTETTCICNGFYTPWKGGAENAGVENAGVENSGVESRGGKCRSGKYRSDNVWKAVKQKIKFSKIVKNSQHL